jgi:hypothetical protein
MQEGHEEKPVRLRRNALRALHEPFLPFVSAFPLPNDH